MLSSALYLFMVLILDTCLHFLNRDASVFKYLQSTPQHPERARKQISPKWVFHASSTLP